MHRYLCERNTLTMGTRRTGQSPAVANALLGIQQLGLRIDSDDSPLHQLSQRLPDGMFDGHGSVLPAPDHLLFHGLARCCLKALFRALPKLLRPAVAASLRDALKSCGLRRTSVYHVRRDKVNSLQIHEWAAVLSVAPLACRRQLPAEIGGRSLGSSPVGAVLTVIDALCVFVCGAYFYPRVELDGGRACRQRYDVSTLEQKAESFMVAVRKLCLRSDCDAFSSILDVPNAHRFQELMGRTIEALGHVRDSLELPLEGFHQQLKRSIVHGNGHDDALRAMRRYVEQEVASRLSLDALAFGIPAAWCSLPGIKEQLLATNPLWSQNSDDWCVGAPKLPHNDVPSPAKALMERLSPGCSVSWRSRCARGPGEGASISDALAVLVTSDGGDRVVDVAVGVAAYSNRADVSFFQVRAFLRMPCGQPAAVVHPYKMSAGGGDHFVQRDRFLFLRMQLGVRRAVALHVCDSSCTEDGRGGLVHSNVNSWRLLGRRDGYPARSA